MRNYPLSQANGTQDLLARITREQASLQIRTIPKPMPSTETAAPKEGEICQVGLT